MTPREPNVENTDAWLARCDGVMRRAGVDEEVREYVASALREAPLEAADEGRAVTTEALTALVRPVLEENMDDGDVRAMCARDDGDGGDDDGRDVDDGERAGRRRG